MRPQFILLLAIFFSLIGFLATMLALGLYHHEKQGKLILKTILTGMVSKNG